MTIVKNLLEIAVPSDTLLKYAKEFENYDIFSTFTKEIKYDAGTNFNIMQVLSLIEGLKKSLDQVSGMEKVGREIIDVFKPFLQIIQRDMKNNTSISEDTSALFGITPEMMEALNVHAAEANEELIKKNMDQVREKYAENGKYDNYETSYYVMLVLVRYSPKNKVFDFYYAYAYSKTTSVWQWGRSQETKKKRLASLELLTLNELGNTIVNRSKGTVTAVKTNLVGYEEKFKNDK